MGSTSYVRLLGDWTEANFRSEIDMFGNKTTRGRQLVNLVLNESLGRDGPTRSRAAQTAAPAAWT
jgi:hypothetical protein